MINVGIIGCGFVGGALKDWLEHNNPECKLFISDPAKGYHDDLSNISTDERTASVTKIRTTYGAGGKSFNPTTGLATVNSGFAVTNTPSSAVTTLTDRSLRPVPHRQRFRLIPIGWKATKCHSKESTLSRGLGYGLGLWK